ncbi:hypothetical protein QJS10_CPB17g01035 [Acorus calamus]|uniref:Uncharacterized protein n=1 Tax=Acorus calamus TaxID=4465 RepID=A0AAV9CZZ5_ACOCL|nr:hypothetical protein QJS10_CPB17g01035 [Acorus calamus]
MSEARWGWRSERRTKRRSGLRGLSVKDGGDSPSQSQNWTKSSHLPAKRTPKVTKSPSPKRRRTLVDPPVHPQTAEVICPTDGMSFHSEKPKSKHEKNSESNVQNIAEVDHISELGRRFQELSHGLIQVASKGAETPHSTDLLKRRTIEIMKEVEEDLRKSSQNCQDDNVQVEVDSISNVEVAKGFKRRGKKTVGGKPQKRWIGVLEKSSRGRRCISSARFYSLKSVERLVNNRSL